jgi:hypothetical protein
MEELERYKNKIKEEKIINSNLCINCSEELENELKEEEKKLELEIKIKTETCTIIEKEMKLLLKNSYMDSEEKSKIEYENKLIKEIEDLKNEKKNLKDQLNVIKLDEEYQNILEDRYWSSFISNIDKFKNYIKDKYLLFL